MPSSELKLLQLDPNALNRRSSEVKARSLSPLRNRPMEKQQHAQKKPRIDMQQENQPGEPVATYLLLNAAELMHIFPVPMYRCSKPRPRNRFQGKCYTCFSTRLHTSPQRVEVHAHTFLSPPLLGTTTIFLPTQASARHGGGRAQRHQWSWGRCGRQ